MGAGWWKRLVEIIQTAHKAQSEKEVLRILFQQAWA